MRKNIIIILIIIILASRSVLLYARGAAGDIVDFFESTTDKFLTFELKENTTTAIDSIVFTGYWLEPLYTGTNIDAVYSYNTIIQNTINNINENPGLSTIILHPQIDPSQGYYNQLEELFATDSAIREQKKESNILLPDIFMLSNSHLTRYYSRGFLEELYSQDLQKHDIDITNWHLGVRALGEVNDRVYGLPLGHDLLVWYINLELFEQAGLIDDNNKPILPSSPEELYEHATLMKEKTGKHYLGVDFLGNNGARTLLTLIWQNNKNIVNKKGKVVFNNLDTRKVTENFFELFKDDLAVAGRGNIKLQLDFAREELGVFINTFSSRYNIEGLLQSDYENRTAKLEEEAKKLAESFDLEDQKQEIEIPPPAPEVSAHKFPVIYNENIVWGNTNLIVIRKGVRKKDPAKYNMLLEILKEIDNNDLYVTDYGLLPNHYTSINKILNDDNLSIFSSTSKLNSLLFIRRDINHEYYYSVQIQDLPQIDQHLETMEILTSMTDDILRGRLSVKHGLALSQRKLVDLIEKDTPSLIR